MNLAILGSRGIPARYGGFETFAEELSARLAARGVSVTVFCEDAGGGRQAVHRGASLVHVPAPKLGPFSTILFDLRCLWRARKAFDVVYLLGYGAALFSFIPRLWGTQVWINPDGVEWRRAKWNLAARLYFKLMEACAVRLADRVIADAEAIATLLRSRHTYPFPCSVIPYGAPLLERPPDPDLIRAWGLAEQGYYLIVCRLEPENHVLEIMRGYAASRTNYPLLVIGDPGLNPRYSALLEGVTDGRIRFTGGIYDREQLQALRYHCRAYFHGHSVGGTNPSLLEALGCGNSIICHDNLFNREVAGDAAVYFRTTGDITAAVEKTDAMPDESRRDVSKTAQQRVRDCYTWDSVVDKYLRLLEESSGPSGKGGEKVPSP